MPRGWPKGKPRKPRTPTGPPTATPKRQEDGISRFVVFIYPEGGGQVLWHFGRDAQQLLEERGRNLLKLPIPDMPTSLRLPGLWVWTGVPGETGMDGWRRLSRYEWARVMTGCHPFDEVTQDG